MASGDNVDVKLRHNIANRRDVDLVSLKNPFHHLAKLCCELKDFAPQFFVEIMKFARLRLFGDEKQPRETRIIRKADLNVACLLYTSDAADD